MIGVVPWAVALLLSAGPAKLEKYPRAELLIEAGALAKPQLARKYRILDTRPAKDFREGRVHGALRVDPGAWNKEFTRGPNPGFWMRELGGLGINRETPVVVYGGDLRETARVWWILDYWGIRELRLLNGGWQAYRAAGGLVDEGYEERPSFTAKRPALKPRPDTLVRKGDLLRELPRHRLQLLDARSTKEYCGEARTAKRNGAIPGARHLEWTEVIDPKSQRFKTPAELARRLQGAGVDLRKPTVTYCQSGGRASVLAFTLELMGAKNVRNYYRSWAEWGNDPDTPIEKPKK
jgi:thiosulfate/3-mercaptopyruvate sulfurtransferase